MSGEFVKRLDDIIRHELAFMGRDYDQVIAGIEEMKGGGGAIIRFHPPWEDLVLEEPEPDLSADALSARVARRLRVTLAAPERPPAPE